MSYIRYTPAIQIPAAPKYKRPVWVLCEFPHQTYIEPYVRRHQCQHFSSCVRSCFWLKAILRSILAFFATSVTKELKSFNRDSLRKTSSDSRIVVLSDGSYFLICSITSLFTCIHCSITGTDGSSVRKRSLSS